MANDNTDRDALASLLINADHESNGSDMRAADYLIANRPAVLRALGLREENESYKQPDLTAWRDRRRFFTPWEDVTDE